MSSTAKPLKALVLAKVSMRIETPAVPGNHCSQPEAGAERLRDEIRVLAVPLDVAVDEGAERQHLQLAAPGVVERGSDQRRREALPLEARLDLGVDEHDQPGPLAV